MADPIVPEPTEAERVATATAKAAEYKASVQAGSHDDRPADHEEPVSADVAVNPDAPVRPEHVPEKFWDAQTGEVNFEAWSTAHSALETKFHQGETPKNDEAVDDKSATLDSDETPAVDAPDELGAAPVQSHIERATSEYAKDGKLSDAMYDELAAQGLNKSTVDAYIGGQEASAQAQDRMAYDAVDGKDNFDAMVRWASDNATETDLKAYNLQVQSGDNEVVVGAIKSLYSKFQSEGEYEGVRVSGDAAHSATNRYASKQEYDAAMREPSDTVAHKTLYETDAAYRTAVSKKMAASRKAGIDLFNASTARG